MNHKSSKMPTKAKKTVVKEKTTRKKSVPTKRKLEPEYMIQVPDPKMVRKDILESLREIIIFMQGYEKFKKIQEEKVLLFKKLQLEVKGINSLIDVKLRELLPKGNMHAVRELPQLKPQIKVQKIDKVVPVMVKPKSELDELESQLKDIEGQLQDLK